MRYGLSTIGAATLAVMATGAAFGRPAGAAAGPSAVLPPGPGHDTMLRVCSGCHAPEIAAQQRLSREGWRQLVDQMASRGADAGDAELDRIIDYLARSFPGKDATATSQSRHN